MQYDMLVSNIAANPPNKYNLSSGEPKQVPL